MRKVSYPVVCMLILLLYGCADNSAQREAKKWKVTLEPNDKRPYGTYIAAQSIKYFFPQARVETVSPGFRYTDIDSSMTYNASGRSLLILQGLDFYVSGKEWDALKSFILTGNEVIILCSHLDSKIEDELGCYKVHQDMEELPANIYNATEGNKDALIIAGSPGRSYGYQGRSLKGYFSVQKEHFIDRTEDSSDKPKDEWNDFINRNSKGSDILGYINKDYKEPDFVRFQIGKGHLYIHAAPLVLSNYFLLQPGNEDYLAALWRTFPGDISHVYQNDYYKRTTGQAGLDILMRFPATRIALYMALFILIIYLLFESKRKQRIIPVIPPVKNESVSFVETVGRLYYNKGDHTNLAEKMMQQFLEWVRMHYYLNTNMLDEQFIQQLTVRSGQPEPHVRSLVEMIGEIKTGAAATDDAYLYQLYHNIHRFYKNHVK
jgi:hypothetical protein